MATTTTKVMVYYTMTNTLDYVDPDTWGDILGTGAPAVGWAGTFFAAPGVSAVLPVGVPAGFLDLLNDSDTLSTLIRVTLLYPTKPQQSDLDSMISILVTGGNNAAAQLAAFCTGGSVFLSNVTLEVYNDPA